MAAPAYRILLIEDDLRLAGMLEEYLGKAAFHVVHAGTGARGLAIHETEPMDAIVLDLMLPDMDGLDICRKIRSRSDTPLLMLTARGDATDRVVGLELGADDYLAKPFEPRELLARLRAVLRRGRGGRKARCSALWTARDRSGIPRGAARRSAARSHELPVRAAAGARRACRQGHLARGADGPHQGEALEAFDRSIDVHVSRIRAAIEDDPKKPRRIITIRGAGYVFAKAQT